MEVKRRERGLQRGAMWLLSEENPSPGGGTWCGASNLVSGFSGPIRASQGQFVAVSGS